MLSLFYRLAIFLQLVTPHFSMAIVGRTNIKLADTIHLDDAALGVLRTGRPHRATNQLGGWIIQDVHAPSDIVWQNILDYDNYKHMVPDTLESEVHKKVVHDDGRQDIFVRLAAGNSLFQLNFFLKATHNPEENMLMWTLDADKKSDIDRSVGWWHVIPHPENEQWSRVYYRQEMVLHSRIPRILANAISRSAANSATLWLKKHCEQIQQKTSPDGKKKVVPAFA